MARGGANPYALAAVPVKYELTRLGGGVTSQGAVFPGGLDLTTPSLSLQAGALRDVVNFECNQSGGYSRIQGYERFSGQPAPHDGAYGVMNLSAFVNVPLVGQTVTQAVTGATAVLIAVVNTDTQKYVVGTKVTGTFDFVHDIFVGATLIGTPITTMSPVTPMLNAQYLAAAYDVYRADIGPVPGSGPLRGVVAMTFAGVDNVYAFRDNVGGTACDIYKASPGGWVNVPLFDSIQFTAGAVATPQDGDTLTQGGVTGTIKRIQISSGTIAGGTAAGQLVITGISGGAFAAGAATTSSGTTLTLSGVASPIVIQPGGKYQFDKGNFTGSASTARIYGCDNANKAFEFDGETYAPISTGLPDDRPKFIAIHKNMLFLSYDSSVIHSGVGFPFKYLAVDGGGEIATGDIVTGLISAVGAQTTGTLLVFTESGTNILYGTSPADFNFVSYNNNVSALPYSAQNFFNVFMLDNMGVVSLRTSLNFGNFDSSALTKNIYPFIQAQRAKTTVSAICRAKSQYRLFFNDGYGLYVTMVNDQYLGSCPVQFPNPVGCIDTHNTQFEGEVTYFGSTDSLGYVYQLDVGPSFDGAVIDARAILAWNPIKSPRVLKRFRAASIELQSSFYVNLSFGYQLGYGTPNIGQPTPVSYPANLTGSPFWDSFTWDAFIWDGQTLAPTDVDMTGTGENIQTAIVCGTNYIESFILNSVIYHYSMRRGMRV